MKGKKGTEFGFTKVASLILVVAIVALVALFVFRADILGYFRALPYSDYEPEDEILDDIDVTEFEYTDYSDDVEVVISFKENYANTYPIPHGPDQLITYTWRGGDSENFAWHVKYGGQKGSLADEGDIDGHYLMDLEQRGSFIDGLKDIIFEATQGTIFWYNKAQNIKATLLFFEECRVGKKIVYSTPTIEGERGSEMLSTVIVNYIKASQGDFDDFEFEERTDIEHEVIGSAPKLRMTYYQSFVSPHKPGVNTQAIDLSGDYLIEYDAVKTRCGVRGGWFLNGKEMDKLNTFENYPFVYFMSEKQQSSFDLGLDLIIDNWQPMDSSELLEVFDRGVPRTDIDAESLKHVKFSVNVINPDGSFIGLTKEIEEQLFTSRNFGFKFDKGAVVEIIGSNYELP